MNSPNYPPPGGPQGPQGQPGQPYGGRPPQTPPGGQPYGSPPPQGQPYGGPPPQGPPYGGPGGPGGPGAGPGGPGAPGGQGGPGGPGYPPPSPAAPAGKPNNAATIIKIVLGVIVIGVVAFFVIKNVGSSAKSAEVGDCIKVNNASATNADVEKIDCGAKEAAYKVAVVKDDDSAKCPDQDNSNYVYYTEETGLLLCMTLNAKEGDCFKQGSADERVDCGDASATFKVTKILTGTTDPSGCPEGTQNGYVYPEPKMVQCFGDPAGSDA